MRRKGGADERAWRRGAALAAVALAAGGLLAACGLPSDTQARVIPRSQVPAPLLSPVAPATTPPCANAKACRQVQVYLTVTGRFVVPEPRVIVAPPSLTSVLQVLLQGPLLTEQAAGVQTALNGVKLVSVHLAKGVATVNFAPSFGLLSGFQQVLGVAQVVFTVAAVEGNGVGVTFQISGFATDVPIDTGGIVTGPVHVSQYTSLLSPTVAPATTAAAAAATGSGAG